MSIVGGIHVIRYIDIIKWI
jgi:NAD(P)H-dependent FMN reductase